MQINKLEETFLFCFVCLQKAIQEYTFKAISLVPTEILYHFKINTKGSIYFTSNRRRVKLNCKCVLAIIDI